MAKQIGVVQISGAIGEIVGAKKAAGQRRNVFRLRAIDPKNPQTNAQLIQRIKYKSAINTYSALKELLNHSFQGVDYGAPSRNYFMQQAMMVGEGDFPWLVKGESCAFPGKFLISKGTITPLPFYNVEGMLGISLNIDRADLVDNSIGHQTIGWLCDKFITEYPFLREGDQLTFILLKNILKDEKHVACDSDYFRLILNTSNTTTINDYFPANALKLIYDKPNELLFLTKNNPGGLGSSNLAGAVIVSRPTVSENSSVVTWERSNTTLTLCLEGFEGNDSEYAAMFTTDAKKAALESFKKSLDPKSAWYLNQGNLGTTTSSSDGSSDDSEDGGGSDEEQP